MPEVKLIFQSPVLPVFEQKSVPGKRALMAKAGDGDGDSFTVNERLAAIRAIQNQLALSRCPKAKLECSV